MIPPHTTVSNFYYAAVKSGLWEKLLTALVRYTRERAGRDAEPSYAIIDSRSAKTTGPAQERGIMAAKRAVEKYSSIQRFCADAGYRNTFEKNVAGILRLGVDISERITSEWQVLPKRWIVKRTLAWMNNSRRLSKDYEISVDSSQAMCMISAFRVLIARF